MYIFDSRVRYSEIEEDRSLSLFSAVNYFQDCSTFQSEDLKLGIEYLSNIQKAWWLISWQIDILKMPKLGDKIEVGTWAYGFKGMYGYRNFVIMSPQKEILVRADSSWVFMDLEKKRPARVIISDGEKYLSNEDKKLEMYNLDLKNDCDEKLLSESTFTVKKHLLDTYNHVNNAWYIQIARKALENDIDIKSVSVQYKNAATLGDLIQVKVFDINGDFKVELSDSKGKIYAAVFFVINI